MSVPPRMTFHLVLFPDALGYRWRRGHAPMPPGADLYRLLADHPLASPRWRAALDRATDETHASPDRNGVIWLEGGPMFPDTVGDAHDPVFARAMETETPLDGWGARFADSYRQLNDEGLVVHRRENLDNAEQGYNFTRCSAAGLPMAHWLAHPSGIVAVQRRYLAVSSRQLSDPTLLFDPAPFAARVADLGLRSVVREQIAAIVATMEARVDDTRRTPDDPRWFPALYAAGMESVSFAVHADGFVGLTDPHQAGVSAATAQQRIEHLPLSHMLVMRNVHATLAALS